MGEGLGERRAASERSSSTGSGFCERIADYRVIVYNWLVIRSFADEATADVY